MFLSFNGLVQTIGITPARHHTPGEFVDDYDLIIFNNIIFVFLKQGVGAKGLLNVMHHTNIGRIIHAAAFHNASSCQQLL